MSLWSYIALGGGITSLVLGALLWYYKSKAADNASVAQAISERAQEIVVAHNQTVGELNASLETIKKYQDAAKIDDETEAANVVTAGDAATFLRESIPGTSTSPKPKVPPAKSARRTRFILGFARTRRSSVYEPTGGSAPGPLPSGSTEIPGHC